MAGSSGGSSWRLCAKWLIEVGALPPTAIQRVGGEFSHVIDLANLLRDGVVLCQLLNFLRTNAVDLRLISLRSQMSLFGNKSNIRMFLTACKDVFGLKNDDLFDPEVLIDVSKFHHVVYTLSKLSQTHYAKEKGASSFEVAKLDPDGDEEDIYKNLEELALRHGPDDGGEIYDTVDEEEDSIYDDLVSLRKKQDKKNKQNSTRHVEPTPQEVPKEKKKRDYCIMEIVETEKNYVEALNSVISFFIRPLRTFLSASDREKIFMNIEELHIRHKVFYNDLDNAVNAKPGAGTISETFIKHKGQFIIYGLYCSNLIPAQDHIDEVCKDLNIKRKIDECQLKANEGRFRLRDMLSVPMQRILKYHLLLRELIKHTEKTHPEKEQLNKALEAMQDISLFVNEVKRDHEHMQTNQQIQASLTNYSGLELIEYGRPQIDGELKLKINIARTKRFSFPVLEIANNPQLKQCFLFDKVMLVCNRSNRMVFDHWGQDSHEHYITIELIRYEVEPPLPRGRGKWNFVFWLRAKNGESVEPSSVEIYSKTEQMMHSWLESIKLAKDNIEPKVDTDHVYEYASFQEATYCSVCSKLLRGLFFQGYKCKDCKICVHKECISHDSVQNCKPGKKRKAIPKVPRVVSLSPAGQPAAVPEAWKARISYTGTPPPPQGFMRPLLFNGGDVIEILEKTSTHWYMGRLTRTGEKGMVPSSHVAYVPCEVTQEDNMRLGEPKWRSWVRRRPSNIPSEDDVWAAAMKTRPSYEEASPRFAGQPPVGGSSIPSRNGQAFANEKNLIDYPWFVGKMERQEANNHLGSKPQGCYLVRERAEGGYAISIKHESQVKHIRVMTSNGQMGLVESKTFNSLLEMVLFYTDNTLGSVFQGLETTLATPFRGGNAYGSTGASKGGGDATANNWRRSELPAQPHQPSSAVGDAQRNSSIRPFNIIGWAQALYDFAARDMRELTLKEGDLVGIISKAGGHRGWWKGSVGEKIGYFPSTYVEERA
ncbi:guanine nucleotide exchange factor VAV2-like isoform X3 [Amphiura filiformis]|uniref:guanine nucleotide exchange factor VAV2-like isoform X3 n=1 Tax=Amphiura filiformis TaxID=82378 RepID=UPI003B219F77